MPRRAYLDASAIVKLIVAEAESHALRTDVIRRPGLMTSRLGVVETERAIRRTKPAPLTEMRAVLESVDVIELSPELMTRAARLTPVELRTLDAIHLATLLMLGSTELDVVTYDDRLLSAVKQHGFAVHQPGRADQQQL